MRVAVGQINPTIGDFRGNVALVHAAMEQARQARADLLVLPELALCGYPPMDLLEQQAFVDANLSALDAVREATPPGLGVVVGYVGRNAEGGKRLTNSVALLADRRLLASQAKTLLPTYDVFDEARYFEPAPRHQVVEFAGERLGLAVCEDIWWETEPDPTAAYMRDPVKEYAAEGATVIVAPSASPYHIGKPQLRLRLLRQIAHKYRVATVYANTVGANDDLIFDGQSLVVDADGAVLAVGGAFVPDLVACDVGAHAARAATGAATVEPEFLTRPPYAEVEAALATGLGDYLRKTGHDRVLVAVSGGIDSAVVAAVAARALGGAQVTAFSLPSMHSSEGSRVDAAALCANLGVAMHTIPITALYDTYIDALHDHLGSRPADTTEENLQARIRGTLMMAYANRTSGSMLLTTGNKSELATGYATLYGDMAGALAPIADLFKTQVYALAAEINRDGEVIPRQTIDKPPSAELRPDQRDDQSLPPYGILDAILTAYIHDGRSAEEITKAGYDRVVVDAVLGLLARAEHKRRQAPPVLKVSPKAFGPGRRLPIARAPFEARATSSPAGTSAV